MVDVAPYGAWSVFGRMVSITISLLRSWEISVWDTDGGAERGDVGLQLRFRLLESQKHTRLIELQVPHCTCLSLSSKKKKQLANFPGGAVDLRHIGKAGI